MDRKIIEVICPKNVCDIRKITIYLPKTEDGVIFPAPTYGCEFSDGGEACRSCAEHIFKLALKDPTMESYQQPIFLYTIQ